MGLSRRAWTRLNRLRTGVGRFGANMLRWGLSTSDCCDCCAEQTADHITSRRCPIHRSPEGIHGPHTSVPASVSCGVPQGSVLGQILFVLYTTPLSAVIERHSIIYHAYADDSQLQNSATPDRLPDLIDSMRLCIDDIKDWMTDNKLKLNDDKTEVMIISSSRMSTALSIPDSFDIGNASVPFSDTVKNLGVTLDCHLSLKTHVLNLVRTANFELRRIGSIRSLLTTEATATLVSAFILSRLDYCNSLISGCPDL